MSIEGASDDVVVYTAVFGSYDELAPVPLECRDVPWIVFTDDEAVAADGWEPRRVDAGGDPRRAARRVKLLPWEHFDARGHAVWIDANARVLDPKFPRVAVSAARDACLMTWRHPKRLSIEAEARACLRAGKAGPEILAQVERYSQLGFDRPVLYETRTLVWHLASQDARRLGDRWLRECLAWTMRDQVSLPFASWAEGVPVDEFPFDVTPPGSVADALGRRDITKRILGALPPRLVDKVVRPALATLRDRWPLTPERSATLAGRTSNPWLRFVPHRATGDVDD